ncbi:MAG TPA: glycosyltransferase family 87 protein [Rhizomicrobium sp.]|nr:glycosyltransferase family 87 protein [Rhizomicrobium sp.]
MADSHIATKPRDDLRALLIFGGVAFAAMAIGFYWKTHWIEPFPRDATTLVAGRDFLNFWMYGRAALDGHPARFYDPVLYNHALAPLVGHGYPIQNWSYPPSLLLLAAPFGPLGYIPALLCWTALGLAAFCAAAWPQLRNERLLFAVLVSPAAVFCLMSGQSTFLTTAALLAIFGWLDRRPVLAGILVGLLTLKPQIALLLPVMLVASGRWRVLLVASATAVLMAAATAALYGPNIWSVYWNVGVPAQNMVLRDTSIFATHLMPTVFMNAHLAGLGYGLSMALQGLVSICAAATVFWAFRNHPDAEPVKLQALFFACSIAATPYLMGYDALPLALAAVALIAQTNLDGTGNRLAQLAYWLLFLQIGFATLHIPGPALVPVALATYLALDLAGHRSFKPAIATAAL